MPRERDEPVRLTKIYTRGGDAGETSLGDGSRVSKLDARIGAYGTVDELNSALGVVVAGDCPSDIRTVLVRVQNELFDLGADLSVPLEHEGRLRTTQEQVDALERECDRFNARASGADELRAPRRERGRGSTPCRAHGVPTGRARGTRSRPSTHTLNPLTLVYLNRLSDLLFILARAANAADGHEEPLWKPGGR